MYVPLAFFLSFLLWNVKAPVKRTTIHNWLLNYFILLSVSNIVKQIWYSPLIEQINDYVVGGLATLILLILLIIWVIRERRFGRK